MRSTFNNAKECAGKGCERTGTKVLKLRLLNKVGIFCDLCADGLLAEDLAVTEGDVLK
jgi:hypothetical protein